MKKIAMLLPTIFFVAIALGQDADGYYISKKGDTVRGKILVSTFRGVKPGAQTRYSFDPLGNDVPDESREINFNDFQDEFKFSQDVGKRKKIDCRDVKGFGFTYKDRQYHFLTWDVRSNKQISLAPNGFYFILKSIDGYFPIYSYFRDEEFTNNGRVIGNSPRRDVVFKHPTKGFIYLSNQYPVTMKISDAFKYLEFEEEFIKTVDKKDNLIDVVKKYNAWKASK